jgi:hypothetical protein
MRKDLRLLSVSVWKIVGAETLLPASSIIRPSLGNARSKEKMGTDMVTDSAKVLERVYGVAGSCNPLIPHATFNTLLFPTLWDERRTH